MRLNIERLVTDLGGASSVAKITGVVRTAPYGWIKRCYLSSQVLEKIKEHAPEIDFNDYFEDDEHERKTGRSSGLS